MMAAVLPLPMPLTSATRWRHAGLALLLTIAWVLLWYRETALSMLLIWQRSDTFAHGFLVPPIVGWLIWRQRHAIVRHVPQPSLGVLPMVACMGLVWLLGELAAANTLTQAALVGLLVLMVPLLLGWQVARCSVFPLGFLFFAVPLGEFLLPQLMEWTANFTVFALRLSGVPVYREGLNFVIPSGRWSVVEACSGVRYLIASFTVGVLYAYLSYQSLRRRFLFVAASLVVPVVANWIRAYMIVMLAHLSNNRIATGVDHLLYGWLFFGLVIMVMFWVGSRWAQPEPTQIPPLPALNTIAQGAVVPAALAPLWLTAVAVACLCALPHLALWTIDHRGDANTSGTPHTGAVPRTLAAPAVLGTRWALQSPNATAQSPAFKPAYQNPSFEMQAVYGEAGAVVGLYVGGYQHQGRGHALVSSDNVLVQSMDPHWSVAARGSKSLVLDDHAMQMRVSELRRTDLSDSSDRGGLRVWQINWVNGTLTHSDYLTKILGAVSRLAGQRDDAAVIVLYTREASPGQGDAALSAFWADSHAAIQALLLRYTQARADPSTAPNGAHPVNSREGLS